MAQDHFVRHNRRDGDIDWNFNVTFGDLSEVVAMAKAYEPLLRRPELYSPIPPDWLHSTILRVGTTYEYTETEMLAVAELTQDSLSNVHLPQMHLGPPKLIFGNVCFAIKPEIQLEKLYTVVTESLRRVVGPERATKSPYGHFIAHTSFTYTKAHDHEAQIQTALDEANIKSARFKITHMPLIRQWPTNGHYEWEVVKDIEVH